MGLGLKGPDGDVDGGIKRNPRRRVVGSERDEYYVGSLYFQEYVIDMTLVVEDMLTIASTETYGQGSR